MSEGAQDNAIKLKREEIDNLLSDERYGEAIDLAYELDKEFTNAAAYYLGLIYYCGWGVEESEKKALEYFKKAINLHDELEGMSWYFSGAIYLNNDNNDDGIECLLKAEELGENDAKVLLAATLCSEALDFRGNACSTLKTDEYTYCNNLAIKYASASLEMYYDIMETCVQKMDIANWCMFGRNVQLLYNLACRGELTLDFKAENTLSANLQNGLSIFTGQTNRELHDGIWKNVVCVCSYMDKNGYEIIGESFRAVCGLLDSELHKSAEAFYRVRWHMKRIGELRREIDPEILDELGEYLTDLDESFAKMNRKYGNSTKNMMRMGKYPDLSVSYPEGAAPEVESCKNFMVMFREEYENRSSKTNNSSGGGLFGFLRRR